MTSSEALKRSEKSQSLKVFHLENSTLYYVESSESKIAYKVHYESETEYHCSCADFARGYKNDDKFMCKHLLAVLNSVKDGDTDNIQYLKRWRPTLDESFIRKIDDKDFVIYAGLLDIAHQKNLTGIEVELLQFPSDENKNTAICKATVRTIDGKIFTDLGDASPENCNTRVAKHIIRMSSTRAKARALRDCSNVGITAIDEICDLSDVISDDHTKDNVRPFVRHRKAQPLKSDHETPEDVPANNAPAESKPKKARVAKHGNGGEKQVPLISEAQKAAMLNLSRRRGFSIEDIEQKIKEKYNSSVDELTAANAGEFIRYLQSAS